MSGRGARQSLTPPCSRSIHAAPGTTVTELLGLSNAAHRPAHRRPGGVVHPAQLRPRGQLSGGCRALAPTGAQTHNAVSDDAEGAAAVAEVLLLLASAGMAVWVGTAAAGAPPGLGAAFAGGLNVTPVALLCLGAAVLALDWIPRTVLAVGVLPAVAVALMIIGLVGYTRRDLAV